MNFSTDEEMLGTPCNVMGRTSFLITKLPSEKFLINHIFAITFNSILVISTISLNAVAIKTILKSSQLKSKPCYFIILVQSVIDLAVGVFGIPLFIFFLASGLGGITNCIGANLALGSTLIPIGMSSIALSAMTMERYIAILYPYAYTTMVTKKRLLIFVGSGAVVVASVVALHFLNRKLFQISIAAVQMIIFAATVFAYARIYRVVRKLSGSPNRPHDPAAVENETKMKLFLREIKHAKSCFIVVICFGVLCFLPAVILFPLSSRFDKFEWLALQAWVCTLGLSNSTFNSIIFFWTKKMLRHEALKTLNALGLNPNN
jgi:hypothetical protein